MSTKKSKENTIGAILVIIVFIVAGIALNYAHVKDALGIIPPGDNYPFVDGWHTEGETTYIILVESGGQYGFYYYRQDTGTTSLSGYGSIETMRTTLNNYLADIPPRITQQQYDCGNAQLDYI